MKDSDSAYPVFDAVRVNHNGSPCGDYGCIDPGMNLTQYAAIHLKVPMSGDPELDKMIRERVRLDLARQTMAGMLASEIPEIPWTPEDIADRALRFAEVLLAKLEMEAGK